MIYYKHTGKETSYQVILNNNRGFRQVKSVVLKANGYAQVDFSMPDGS